MKKNFKNAFILLLATFLFAACGSDFEPVNGDSNGNGENNGNNGENGGNSTKPIQNTSDVADCRMSISCKNNAIDSDNSTFDVDQGVESIIDNQCHTWYDDTESEVYFPDYDFYAVQLPPGTPVAFTAKASSGSPLIPDITIYDQNGHMLTFNSSEDSSTAAKTAIIAPNANTFYVQVEESKNYTIDPIKSCNKTHPTAVGGDKYKYILTAEKDTILVKEFTHEDNGNAVLKAGAKLQINDTLAKTGEIHYHYFKTEEGAKVKVTLDKKPSNVTVCMSGMNTTNDQMVWMRVGKAIMNKDQTLGDKDFNPNVDNNGIKHYAFAVFELNGLGDSSNKYTVTVSVN